MATPTKISNGVFACTEIDLGDSNGSAIGTGLQNTQNIVAKCSDSYAAARICVNYNNGYQSWFLPSIDELSLVYSNLKARGFGSYDQYYWSSTEGDTYYDGYYKKNIKTAKLVNFLNGSIASSTKWRTTWQVLSVRAF